MNKWIVGLAAAGVIGLASNALAQDGGTLNTPKLGSSTLTGYISTSYHWAVGKDSGEGYTLGDAREDRFALDIVSLTLASSPDSSGDWGAGYTVQAWIGPDADDLLLGGDESRGGVLKNAYISFGDDKGKVDVGRFDTILGVESLDYNLNPHFTRSGGFAIEPTLHEGVKLSYEALSLLWANTIDPSSNGASGNTERKTFGVALGMRARDAMHKAGSEIPSSSWGGSWMGISWLNGDTNGQNRSGSVQNFYAGFFAGSDDGGVGFAWDVREDEGGKGVSDSAVGLYFQLGSSLNIRAERVNDGPYIDAGSDSWQLTTTFNVRLQDGVLSRLEYRYTAMDDATGTTQEHSHGIWANLIYEF